jgi:hypothetical protein
LRIMRTTKAMIAPARKLAQPAGWFCALGPEHPTGSAVRRHWRKVEPSRTVVK